MNENETLNWCSNTISLMKDGSVWAIPRSNMILKINKSKKTFTIVQGYSKDEIDAFNYWFGKLGYRIENE